MIQIKDGKIKLFKSRKLTKRQQHFIKTLSDSNVQLYLKSLLGMKARFHRPLYKHQNEDLLSSKSKNSKK